MTYLQQLRGLDRPVLLVDGGDTFFRIATNKAPDRTEERRAWLDAMVILNAYNVFGYDAVAVGPQDLQLGLDSLQRLARDARFPLLCANLVDKATKKPYFQPYIIKEVGGVRFGIYAVIQERVNPNFARRVIPDGEILDPRVVSERVVAELKEKSDIVIALSHCFEKTNTEILAKNPDIDAMVDPLARFGSKLIWVSGDEDYCREIHGTPRLRIDGQGARVGVFEMTIDPATKKYSSYEGYNVALEPHIMDHPAMSDLMKLVRRGGKFELPANFDPSERFPIEELAGAEACAACHEEQDQFWKSTRHANNFETLVPIGATERTDCIGCHTLGYGIAYTRPIEAQSFKEVQCENCHGIEPKHATNPRAYRFGEVSDGVCWGCHNPEYTQKQFSYTETIDKVSCPKMKPE